MEILDKLNQGTNTTIDKGMHIGTTPAIASVSLYPASHTLRHLQLVVVVVESWNLGLETLSGSDLHGQLLDLGVLPGQHCQFRHNTSDLDSPSRWHHR